MNHHHGSVASRRCRITAVWHHGSVAAGLSQAVAAVDRDDLARDETCIRPGEEHDVVGDVGW
jgi:hypothetical protein